MENGTVTISLERYDELRACEVLCEQLMLSFAILLDKAILGYDGKSLRFDDNDVNDLLKVYDMNKYIRTIKRLKEKKESGEKTDE